MLTLHMPPNLESRLRYEAAKQGLEPDAFVVRAVERALGNGSPAGADQSTARESELLSKTSIGVSEEVWRRYRELRAKSDSGELSPSERTEILSITDKIEVANGLRMQSLIDLAELRNIPLEQLMDQLGLGNGLEVAGESNGG